MKKTVEHIKHSRLNSEICSFYICNIFKIDNHKIELNDIFEFDLLHEKYFQKEKNLNRFSESQNGIFWKTRNKTEVIDSYGPILKPTISMNDFEKLNFKEYNSKIESIIYSWRKDGDEYEASELEIFHNKFLIELSDFFYLSTVVCDKYLYIRRRFNLMMHSFVNQSYIKLKKCKCIKLRNFGC